MRDLLTLETGSGCVVPLTLFLFWIQNSPCHFNLTPFEIPFGTPTLLCLLPPRRYPTTWDLAQTVCLKCSRDARDSSLLPDWWLDLCKEASGTANRTMMDRTLPGAASYSHRPQGGWYFGLCVCFSCENCRCPALQRPLWKVQKIDNLLKLKITWPWSWLSGGTLGFWFLYPSYVPIRQFCYSTHCLPFVGVGNGPGSHQDFHFGLTREDYDSLRTAIDLDVERTETYLSHFQESLTLLSEVVL